MPRPGQLHPATLARILLRRKLLPAALLLGGLLVFMRAVKIQAYEHEMWRTKAEEQQRSRVPLPARRGAIYDRGGVPLALSHETYQISVAPREVRDVGAVIEAIHEHLELSASDARAAVVTDRKWVVLKGRFTARQRDQLKSIRGLHFERKLDRFYPHGSVAREIVGVVSRDAQSLGGIEQQYHDLLSGTPGYSIMRRDSRGNALPAPSLPVLPPEDGGSVYLTIDLDIQEVIDTALRDAIRTTGASGGDIVILQPYTGEILAAASYRRSGTRTLASATDPSEPGSTIKPLMVASMMEHGKVRMDEVFDAHGGIWQLGNRTIRDVARRDELTMFDAIRVSSNIVMVKAAQRLSRIELFEILRDFGIGTPTGIDYPAESGGRLRMPAQWSGLSASSLAMGYEVGVTPLQMVAAYAVLANGGTLMEPYLVREVRNAAGEVVFRREPTEVRRILSQETAARMTDALVAVVEDGTAKRAGMDNFEVAGKTGTSRRTGPNGQYVQGSYIASFVGYFPARDPMFAIYVKLDEPKGVYYGGQTAAPVSSEVMKAVLAASARSLDGRVADSSARESNAASAPPAHPGSVRAVVSIPIGHSQSAEGVVVPTTEGLDLREAARRLHAAGLSAQLEGTGRVATSDPEAGTVVPRGTPILIVGKPAVRTPTSRPR
jgi:cell division protein FtsI (penicillin-binding protein 3)